MITLITIFIIGFIVTIIMDYYIIKNDLDITTFQYSMNMIFIPLPISCLVVYLGYLIVRYLP